METVMNLKQFSSFIALFSILLFTIPAKAEKYFTLDQYIKLHPIEKILEDRFNKIVKRFKNKNCRFRDVKYFRLINVCTNMHNTQLPKSSKNEDNYVFSILFQNTCKVHDKNMQKYILVRRLNYF